MKAVGTVACAVCDLRTRGYKPRGWKPGGPLATWRHRHRGLAAEDGCCAGSYRPGHHGTLWTVPVPELPDICNTHQQLQASGAPWVAILVSWGGIRAQYVQGWSVYRLLDGKQVATTDPKAPWYEHGAKVFRMVPRHSHGTPNGTFAERRRAALQQAQAWVAAQGWYAGAWARNASGDYVPAAVQARFPIRRRGAQVPA